MRRSTACLILFAVIGCGKQETAEVPPPAPPAVDRMNVAFDEATAATPPQDTPFAPEKTLTGKPTADVVADVRKAWDTIRFDGPDGKTAPTRATIRTAEGDIEITLNPDAAPSHVRNFLALAKVGFFDGLTFERVVRQETVGLDGSRTRYEFLTAGCPLGDGGQGKGHIGYFLKPEFNEKIPHEEGTVGYWREDDDNSAGTRFYIMLGPCPPMNGKYTVIGKVTLGMEFVHNIANSPVRDPDYEKPVAPVVIRQIVRQP